MESLELKSIQSKFYDSNNTSNSKTLNTTVDKIEIETNNNAILSEENQSDVNKSNKSSYFLDKFLSKTCVFSSESEIIKRLEILITNSLKDFKLESDSELINKEKNLFNYEKRKEPLLSNETSTLINRLVSKKYLIANFMLVNYIENILIFKDLSELSTNKETIIGFINCVLFLIKEVNSPNNTIVLYKRLNNFINKVLNYFSSDKEFQDKLKLATLQLTNDDNAVNNNIKNLYQKILDLEKLNKIAEAKQDKYDEFINDIFTFIKDKIPSAKEQYDVS